MITATNADVDTLSQLELAVQAQETLTPEAFLLD